MYFGYKSFVSYVICKCLLPACSLSSRPLDIALGRAWFFIFMRCTNSSIFSSADHAFGVISKSSLLNTMVQRFLLCFFLKGLYYTDIVRQPNHVTMKPFPTSVFKLLSSYIDFLVSTHFLTCCWNKCRL